MVSNDDIIPTGRPNHAISERQPSMVAPPSPDAPKFSSAEKENLDSLLTALNKHFINSLARTNSSESNDSTPASTSSSESSTPIIENSIGLSLVTSELIRLRHPHITAQSAINTFFGDLAANTTTRELEYKQNKAIRAAHPDQKIPELELTTNELEEQRVIQALETQTKKDEFDNPIIKYKAAQELIRYCYLSYIHSFKKAELEISDLSKLEEADRQEKLKKAAAIIYQADRLLLVYTDWFKTISIKKHPSELNPENTADDREGGQGEQGQTKHTLLIHVSHEIKNPASTEWVSPAVAAGSLIALGLFGVSTYTSFFDVGNGTENPDQPPAYDDPSHNEPLPAYDGSDEGLIGLIENENLANFLIWGSITAAGVTNAANYGAGLEDIFRKYLHNLNEIFKFWKDGTLYDGDFKPVPITKEQKVLYALQIAGYAIGWTIVLTFSFVSTFGLAGLAILPFVFLSMTLAGRFVIDAHVNHLNQKLLDVFKDLWNGKDIKANLAVVFFGVVLGVPISLAMGYAFFGKFIANFVKLLELNIDLIALGTAGGPTTALLLLTILPIVIGLYVLNSPLPDKYRYAIGIPLLLIGLAALGAGMAFIGWELLIIALAAMVGTLVSIVVLKMLINSALRFRAVWNKFVEEVFTPVWSKSAFGGILLVLLMIIPLVGLVVLNAIANAVLSTFGLDGVIPMMDAFTVGEIEGMCLLILMMGFSLSLGSRSILDLATRFSPFEAVMGSTFLATTGKYSAFERYAYYMTVGAVVFAASVAVITVFGVAKAITHLVPQLFDTAINLFVMTFQKGTQNKKMVDAHGNFEAPKELRGFLPRLFSLAAGLVAITAAVALAPAAIPAYLTLKLMSAVFKAALDIPKPDEKAAVAPAPITDAGVKGAAKKAAAYIKNDMNTAASCSSVFDNMMTSAFKGTAKATKAMGKAVGDAFVFAPAPATTSAAPQAS